MSGTNLVEVGTWVGVGWLQETVSDMGHLGEQVLAEDHPDNTWALDFVGGIVVAEAVLSSRTEPNPEVEGRDRVSGSDLVVVAHTDLLA